MEENLIIKRCQSGYREYFELLVNSYEQPLFKYCYYLTSNEEKAKDLYQQTWLKAVDKINQYSNDYSFKNWLLSIATNTYRDGYRKEKRWSQRLKEYFSQQTVYDQESPEKLFLDRSQGEQLREAVKELQHHYKAVVILFYFEEKSLKEISYILGIPIGTVKSRLAKAKKILRQMLEVKA